MLLVYSSIDPPRSKPCLVNRTRSMSLDNTSSNEDCGPEPRSTSPSVAAAIARAAAMTSNFRDVENKQTGVYRPHNLELPQPHYYTSNISGHAGCRGDHCKAVEWIEPIFCSSPRPTSSGKLTLVVDDTRFIVDAELFKPHPETMLGRWVVRCHASYQVSVN